MNPIDQTMVNPALNDEAREIRRTIPMRGDPGDLEAFIRCWSEDDVLDGAPCKALVVILKTRGCTWALAGGCTMCGYANESAWQKVSADQLVAQFERAWRRYDDEAIVKIYTSGSFLDPKEVMPEAQTRILQIIGDRPQKVAFESLPTFIQDDTFAPLEGLVRKMEVGIGVESSNDRVLRDSINKGHGFAAFPKAAQVCRRHGVSVKSYLMCKPPFLTESDALEDATRTIIAAAPHADIVSLNPTNVQGRTVVDALYRRGSYRPPWLWTIVHALLDADRVVRPETADESPDRTDEAGLTASGRSPAGDKPGRAFSGIIKSDVIAAGQDRGAHNCGRCDERVVGYLKKYKETQERRFLEMCLERVDCPCREEWGLTLALGPLIPAYAGL